MILVTKALKSTVGEDNSNAETSVTKRICAWVLLTLSRFIVANRKVGTGLVASAVVSVSSWGNSIHKVPPAVTNLFLVLALEYCASKHSSSGL